MNFVVMHFYEHLDDITVCSAFMLWYPYEYHYCKEYWPIGFLAYYPCDRIAASGVAEG